MKTLHSSGLGLRSKGVFTFPDRNISPFPLDPGGDGLIPTPALAAGELGLGFYVHRGNIIKSILQVLYQFPCKGCFCVLEIYILLNLQPFIRQRPAVFRKLCKVLWWSKKLIKHVHVSVGSQSSREAINKA